MEPDIRAVFVDYVHVVGEMRRVVYGHGVVAVHTITRHTEAGRGE